MRHHSVTYWAYLLTFELGQADLMYLCTHFGTLLLLWKYRRSAKFLIYFTSLLGGKSPTYSPLVPLTNVHKENGKHDNLHVGVYFRAAASGSKCRWATDGNRKRLCAGNN